MSRIILLLALTSFAAASAAQTRIALPAPLNVALGYERNPSITADGKYMVLESDFGDEGNFYPFIAKRVGNNWTRPEEITSIYKGVVWNGGYNIAPDGNTIVFSSNRVPSVGGKDILISNRTDEESWSRPENPGAPLNSKGDETDPALTPDNQQLFFIKADKKVNGRDCGKIYVAQKSPTTWKDPVALPSNVNTGCNCGTRILADNKTLIFASDRPGGKGGFDIYKSVRQYDGTWSDPVNLDFVNTAEDEVYAAIQADGRFLFTEGDRHERTDIFQYKLPEEHRPKKTLWMSGKVLTADLKKPTTTKIHVRGLNSGKEYTKIYNNPSDGSFFMVLAEDEPMNISIYPFAKNYSYGSYFIYPEQYANHFSQASESVALLPLKPEKRLTLNNVNFEADMKTLTTEGKAELEKLVYIMKNNSSVEVEVGAHMEEYKEDSIKADGLTEVRYDTVMIKEIVSRTIMVPDTTPVEIKPDTIAADSALAESTVPEEADEPAMIEKIVKDTVEKEVVKVTYHNDYTPRLAKTVKNYLKEQGIEGGRIRTKGYGDRKKSQMGGEFDKRVEITVL